MQLTITVASVLIAEKQNIEDHFVLTISRDVMAFLADKREQYLQLLKQLELSPECEFHFETFLENANQPTSIGTIQYADTTTLQPTVRAGDQ